MEDRKKSFRASHVWLYAKDIEKSVSFYQKVLGLDLAGKFPHGALFRAGGIMIGIHSEEADLKTKPGSTVIVFETDDIGKSFHELKNRGVRFLVDQIQTEQFGRFADFEDPDGYLLEIWQSGGRRD